MSLTIKQEKFITSYIQLGNATKAAILAGYSPKTAYSIANENLKKPEIQLRLTELRASFIADSKGKIADRIERLETLTELMRESIKVPITAKEKVMAIGEVNKMLGDYAPEKHAVLGDIVIEVVYKERRNPDAIKQSTNERTQETG